METEREAWEVAWERVRRAGRIPVMVLFALGCFGLLLFLWISFGGAVPLRANQYRLKVDFPEATTLAEAADVRVSGVNVGKVQSKALDKGANRTRVVLAIDPKYAPLPRDTRAILRQKTLLGETFVELTPGRPAAGKLKDGATLPDGQVEPTVELDEILRVFDPKTKTAFRDWVAESARQISGAAPQDLNDALGNLAAFASDGSTLLEILNQQSTAVHDLVRNTGQVFQALNQRQGALHDLVLNSHATFSATAQEQAALAQTFEIFPTFLDQARLAANRLQRFATNTHPLVNALKPAATDLAPTIHNLGALAPDLRNFFTHLKPVIKAAPNDLPQGARFLRAAAPVFDSLHPFLTELNPFLSYLNYTQQIVAHFLTNLGAATSQTRIGGAVDTHLLNQIGVINGRSLNIQQTRPVWDRGNTYVGPTTYDRATLLKIGAESLSCPNGTQRNPIDSSAPGNTSGELQPCFPAGPSLYSGTDYPQLLPGKVLLKPPPSGLAGPYPADPEKHP